jgi:hypothetical protein
MTNEYIDGDANAMHDIGSNFGPPPADVARPVGRTPPHRCSEPGLTECHDLCERDANATVNLQTYLTHVMEGLTAFKAMVVASAQCYADGDGMGAREFDAILDRRDLNLTDRAPIFEPPSRPAGG